MFFYHKMYVNVSDIQLTGDKTSCILQNKGKSIKSDFLKIRLAPQVHLRVPLTLFIILYIPVAH